MSYQPQWIDGKTVGNPYRDAEGRFKAIADNRPKKYNFTALDLGAHQGYFSHRLAGEFGAKVVAVDDCPLLEPARNVTVLRKRMSAQDISALRHVDMALCLSVLHHVPDWRNLLDALVDVSDALFVETAVPEENLPTAVAHKDSAAIHARVEELGGKVLTYTPGYDKSFKRPLWVIR